MKRHVRIINGLFLFIFTVIFFSFHKYLSCHWKYGFLDEILDVVGISFICLGFLLRISARGYKQETLESNSLFVSDGPYALLRNPMYLGTFIISLGIIFFVWKWWIVFIFIPLFIIRYMPQIKDEEEFLRSHFGKDFELYCKQVPRLLPNLSLLFKENIKKFLPIKYKWIKKELLNMITVITLSLIVELHEDVSHYGRDEFIREPILLINVVLYFILLTLFLSRQRNSTY